MLGLQECNGDVTTSSSHNTGRLVQTFLALSYQVLAVPAKWAASTALESSFGNATLEDACFAGPGP